MKRLAHTLIAAALALIATPAPAAVGYVNTVFSPGNSLFGNPLQNAPNHLSNLFTLPPEGTAVGLWNPATLSFGSVSVFQGGTWSVDFTLAPGTGAMLTTPAPFTNTFVGEVLAPDGSAWSGTSVPPPAYSGPDGVYLWSSKFPAVLGSASAIGSVWEYIVGRAPHQGEQFGWLDLGQNLQITTFLGGAWTNGDPALGVGQAGFFNIGPVPIPEPAAASLLALAFGVFGLARAGRRNG